ncbi:hypothetical protein F4781DRAFT_438923 [Annulohypoxylon bovei var. microspora]|nr:hypothetical protein F4781DRAFT_438923 [Annulohypoxylon bovei var. microspora]
MTIVYRGIFSHFSRVSHRPITILFSSLPPKVGTPFIVCWRWTSASHCPQEFLYPAVIQKVTGGNDETFLTAIHHAEFRMELSFSDDLARLSFQLSDDLGSSTAPDPLERVEIPELEKFEWLPNPSLYVGIITDIPSAIGEVLLMAFSEELEKDKSIFAFWHSADSPLLERTSVTRINSIIRNVEHQTDQSSSLFQFDHSEYQFSCVVERGGKELTSKLHGSGNSIRMIKVGWSLGFFSKTVTLKNNTCEILRYQIRDSGKHKVEEISMGILSVIPTFGLDKIPHAGMILKKAAKIAEWISAGLTLKSMWHVALQDDDNVRGLLYPNDTVERETRSSDIVNDNDVVIEQFSFDEPTNSIVVDIFELSRAGNKTYHLSDLLQDDPPDRWEKSTQKWSLTKPQECRNDRAIQIPKFIPKVGEVPLEGFQEDYPHGVIYCMDKGDMPRIFPYTFSSPKVPNHSTIALYDDSKCSYYIQSKSGDRCGSIVKNLPTQNHTPVVIFECCCLRQRGKLRCELIGSANYGEDVDESVLMIIESKLNTGKSYWGVSVDEHRNVYGYPEVPPSYQGDKWVLQKSENNCCSTYFVGKYWFPVY